MLMHVSKVAIRHRSSFAIVRPRHARRLPCRTVKSTSPVLISPPAGPLPASRPDSKTGSVSRWHCRLPCPRDR